MKNLIPLAIGAFVLLKLLKKKGDAVAPPAALPTPPKAPPPSAGWNTTPDNRPTTYPSSGTTGSSGIYTGGGQVQPL